MNFALGHFGCDSLSVLHVFEFDYSTASYKVGKESKRYDVKEWAMHDVYSVNQKFKDCNLIDAAPCT